MKTSVPTTYEFTMLPLSAIKIEEEGQRKEFKNIDSLADSIKRNGLLHPIVIRRDGTIVAGRRRFRAMQLLGAKEIPVHYLHNISKAEAEAIQLEENIKRTDLTWQENALATLEYHELLDSLNQEWTIEKTGESIGLTRSYVGKLIRVAQGLKSKSPRVVAAEGIQAAFKAVQREQKRVVETKVSQLKSIAAQPKVLGKQEGESSVSVEILCTDFVAWAQSYDGRKFNFIHCDFPYGIGYNKTKYQGSRAERKYDDSFDLSELLLVTLCKNRERLFFPSAHLIFWFSMSYYAWTKYKLTQAGFIVNPFPLIWAKDRGIIPDPERTPRRVYETAFLCSLGDRKIIRSSPNLVSHLVTKEGHISAKPRAMLESFFRIFIDDLTEILDPTCGSGSALAAAKALGAKRLLGLDISQEYVNLAKVNTSLAEEPKQ